MTVPSSLVVIVPSPSGRRMVSRRAVRLGRGRSYIPLSNNENASLNSVVITYQNNTFLTTSNPTYRRFALSKTQNHE